MRELYTFWTTNLTTAVGKYVRLLSMPSRQERVGQKNNTKQTTKQYNVAWEGYKEGYKEVELAL